MNTSPSPLDATCPSTAVVIEPFVCAESPGQRTAGELWVVRDDRLSLAGGYGGNKARKAFDLRSRLAGRRRLLTFGAPGSHHVLSCALAVPDCEIVVVGFSQTRSAHAEQVARINLGLGVTFLSGFSALTKLRNTLILPPGGSSAMGADVFRRTAFSLFGTASESSQNVSPDEAQKASPGQRPWRGAVDRVVVAMGSAGTAAGLAAGLLQAGVPTIVEGVLVGKGVRGFPTTLHPSVLAAGALAPALERRFRATSPREQSARSLFRHPPRAPSNLRINSEKIAGGYGARHPDGPRVFAHAREQDLILDPTYTEKAFLVALERARAGERVVYWHTLASAGVHERLAMTYGEGQSLTPVARFFSPPKSLA